MSEKFIVRMYDGFDNNWIDVCKPVSKEEAEKILAEHTENGTKNISYNEIDYYKIFPADTVMIYSEEGREQARRQLNELKSFK